MRAIARDGELASIAKDRSDAILNDAKTRKTLAEVDETRADTVKTVEEARKTANETAVLESQPITDVNVVI